MKLLDCTRCGSTQLVERNGTLVCVYCRATYAPQSDGSPGETMIGIASDIQALLKKCREDPENRRRLANLILDLDPTNQEAKQYLL